jgi:transposase
MEDTVSTMDEKRRERKPRRAFSEEFKAGVIRLVVEEGHTQSSVARDMGLSLSTVALWCRQARIDRGSGAAGPLTTEERAELSRLRKENRDLRMERDLLKKATAFFAKHGA